MNLKVTGWIECIHQESCDIVLRTFRVQLDRSTARECLLMRSPSNVIFCGDMQLLFCLQGRYIGTDISKTAFQYMDFVLSTACERLLVLCSQ